MDYREYRVSAPLAAVVECVWFLRGATSRGSSAGDADADADMTQRVLPDGCIELIVHLGDAFESMTDGGAPTRQARSLLVGLLTRPLALRPPACVETMGIRFRPGGAYPFVSLPLAELTDTTVSLDDLWGASGRRLIDRLGDAGDDDTRLAIVTQALTAHLIAGQRERDPLIDGVVASLVRSAGCAGIADLAARAGVTPRHLQRRFQDRVGVGPKVLARILRFQNTLRHRGGSAAATPIEWAQVAVACGYADQSHLIREYSALAGETPASLIAAEGELSSYFTSPQRLAALLGPGLPGRR